MKILLINKFLYPKGGAENYLLKLGNLLEQQGHEVQYFGMVDSKNVVGNEKQLLVSPIDFSTGILRNLAAPLRIIYNAEARRKLYQILNDFCPDVVHLNNIQYHLTPSVILAVRDYRRKRNPKLKLISTAHDYQLICPNHGLFDSRGQYCEHCLHGSFFHCFIRKCVKNSYLKSLLAVMDAFVWKISRAYEQLDVIICPSEFMKSKLEQDVRFKGKCVVLNNFVEAIQEKEIDKKDYVLEFGHLSKEKGTLMLVEAAKRLPDIPFVFAGFGPAEEEVRKLKNAKLAGYQSGEVLEQLIREARITVIPSLWSENCPYSVLESQMYGTAVIGSNMGGIPELLRNGRGMIFEAGNIEDLTRKIRLLWNDEDLRTTLSECAKKPLESTDSYYEKLMKLYGGLNENI